MMQNGYDMGEVSYIKAIRSTQNGSARGLDACPMQSQRKINEEIAYYEKVLVVPGRSPEEKDRIRDHINYLRNFSQKITSMAKEKEHGVRGLDKHVDGQIVQADFSTPLDAAVAVDVHRQYYEGFIKTELAEEKFADKYRRD